MSEVVNKGILNMARLTILWVAILVVFCSCASIIPPPRVSNTKYERWECYEHFSSRKLGTLTADRDDNSGTVDFGGIVANTEFSIQGIERRWDWDFGADGRSDSAIVVSTDGSARFYDFRASIDGIAKPSDLFRCKIR